MIRTVVKPDNQKITIEVPENFIGKNVEVIAFAIEEINQISDLTDRPLTHFVTEKTLSKDWQTPEEDLAWQDL